MKLVYFSLLQLYHYAVESGAVWVFTHVPMSLFSTACKHTNYQEQENQAFCCYIHVKPITISVFFINHLTPIIGDLTVRTANSFHYCTAFDGSKNLSLLNSTIYNIILP